MNCQWHSPCPEVRVEEVRDGEAGAGGRPLADGRRRRRPLVLALVDVLLLEDLLRRRGVHLTQGAVGGAPPVAVPRAALLLRQALDSGSAPVEGKRLLNCVSLSSQRKTQSVASQLRH